MIKRIIIILTFAIPDFLVAQDYITSEIISRVFHMKNKSVMGTTFLIDKDSTNYFVTAKHVIENAKFGEKITIEIYQDSLWKILSGNVYFDTTKNVDVALIKPEGLSFVQSGISLKSIPMILGDEGFFMGFPYGLSTSDAGNINSGFPFPLVKKAVYSGSSTENEIFIILLDGHNNPGFSGGPVLFKDRFKSGDNKYHLVGVVSAYVNQQNELVTPFGTMKYIENSGIIISHGKKHIDEIIGIIKTP